MLYRILLMLAMAGGAALAADPPRLLVVGDSLSAGYGIDPASGWVGLLAQRLEATGARYRVINASISGDTSAGGLRRLPVLLEQHRPAVVVIALGANDGLRGLPLQSLHDNLVRMVGLARAQTPAVLLVGVRMPPNYGPRYAAAFQDQFRRVAESTGTALVPALLAGVGERLEWMQEDGLHPRSEAQPRILDNVWPHLRALLEAAH